MAELGYFCGLVIGDGCLQVVGHKKAKRVTFYSTDLDLIRFFSEAVKTILPEARVGGTWCKNSGGFTSTKPLREVWVYSQALYDLLRPWKQADFKWQIPDFLTLPDAIKGFIQAIFDTEGGFSDDHAYATSKHASGLQQVNQLLATYGIKCRIDPNGNAFKLSTRRYEDLVTFVSSVGFRLPRKQQKALSFIEHKEGTRIKECPDCGRKLLSAQALATHKHYRHTGRAKVV